MLEHFIFVFNLPCYFLAKKNWAEKVGVDESKEIAGTFELGFNLALAFFRFDPGMLSQFCRKMSESDSETPTFLRVGSDIFPHFQNRKNVEKWRRETIPNTRLIPTFSRFKCRILMS